MYRIAKQISKKVVCLPKLPIRNAYSRGIEFVIVFRFTNAVLVRSNVYEIL